jgi:hypothetical protein
MNKYKEVLYETCCLQYLASVLLELLHLKAVMRADYVIDSELSNKETISVLQAILAICCERDLVPQGLVAQEGI